MPRSTRPSRSTRSGDQHPPLEPIELRGDGVEHAAGLELPRHRLSGTSSLAAGLEWRERVGVETGVAVTRPAVRAELDAGRHVVGHAGGRQAVTDACERRSMSRADLANLVNDVLHQLSSASERRSVPFDDMLPKLLWVARRPPE